MVKLSPLLFLGLLITFITVSLSTSAYSLKCRFNQYTVENVLGNLSCIDCFPCMPGSGLSPQCGGYVKYGAKIECQPCQHGITYSATNDIGSCRPCGICSDHQKVIRNCTLESNSECDGSCSSGFYYEEITGVCKPCSFCCSDGRNTVKGECKDMPFYKQCETIEISCQPKCLDDQYLVVTRKGAHCENCKSCPPENKQCSYTQQAIDVCQQKNDKTIIHSKSSVIIIVVAIGIGIITVAVLVFCWYLKYRRCRRLPRSPESLQEEELQSQSTSMTLEDQTAHGSEKTLSFDKSSVLVQFSDAQSFFADAQRISIEICWDKNFIKTLLHHDEVQLSPVVKFHPNGLQLSKPAEVRIPHSALVFYSNGWQLKLKSSTLHGENIVWKDEELYQVHNNEVSFQVNYLLSYVVVGASLCNNKPTKKRLQCAVFGEEGRVGVDYTAYLFVFDDCKASLEKIMQEERSNNRILLASPQSIYVESVTNTDIKISVKQPVEGWIVGDIKPEVITHESLKESYQTIPRAEILFKHDNGRNRDVLCVFELRADNATTTICAVASIKEDQFVITGRNLCDSKLLSGLLHESDLETICECLDTPIPGLGHYRAVALYYDFSHYKIASVLEKHYEGPSRALIEWLAGAKPELTVREFVTIVRKEAKRNDVAKLLEAYDANS